MIGFDGSAIMPCPVDGCDRDLGDDLANAPSTPLHLRKDLPIGEAITEATDRVMSDDIKAREAALRAHLETHDVMDWMQTVRRLEQELYNAGPTGIRPHVSQQPPTAP